MICVEFGTDAYPIVIFREGFRIFYCFVHLIYELDRYKEEIVLFEPYNTKYYVNLFLECEEDWKKTKLNEKINT